MTILTDADVDLFNAKQSTKDFEGFRDTVYKDTKGKNTIGYGFNIDDPTVSQHIPTAVKLRLRKITKEESDKIFDVLYDNAKKDVVTFIGEDVFNSLNPKAKNVLTDMSYNMGLKKLSGFKKMKAAIHSGDMESAAEEMKNSKWFGQVGNRSKKHYETMRGLSITPAVNIPDDFKSAFKDARRQGVKEFVYKGKKYTTEVK